MQLHTQRPSSLILWTLRVSHLLFQLLLPGILQENGPGVQSPIGQTTKDAGTFHDSGRVWGAKPSTCVLK